MEYRNTLKKVKVKFFFVFYLFIFYIYLYWWICATRWYKIIPFFSILTHLIYVSFLLYFSFPVNFSGNSILWPFQSGCSNWRIKSFFKRFYETPFHSHCRLQGEQSWILFLLFFRSWISTILLFRSWLIYPALIFSSYAIFFYKGIH